MEKEKEMEQIKRDIYIYACGYSTGSDFTISEYLNARDRVSTQGTIANMVKSKITEEVALKWNKK